MNPIELAQNGRGSKSQIVLHRLKTGSLFVAMLVCFMSTHSARTELVFQQLYEFFPTNSAHPATRLTEGSDGCFYGMTTSGGSNHAGTVFRITPAGGLTTLVRFDGTNGSWPDGGLVQTGEGYLYGTTRRGGGEPSVLSGWGTVFRVTTNGVLTNLFSFSETNGIGPTGLVPGRDGYLYGTTYEGGTFGYGSVFKITTNGNLTVLFHFNGTSGGHPRAGLIAGNDGNFYGTTSIGGSNFTGGYSGDGTVFRITTNGLLTSLVYFSGTNGALPTARLSLGDDQKFYGTTTSGGTNSLGTVYQMTTNGELTTLFHFNGDNGSRPFSGVTQGRDGNFYGTTAYRVVNSKWTFGTIFKLMTNGALTTLVYLSGTNGLHPFTDLVLSSDGNLYGEMADAERGESLNGNAGTIYRLAEQPKITSLTHSNGNVTLTWTSFTNGIYRVESNPSPTAPNWTPLVPEITATGGSAAFTNPAGTEPQGFYRVRLIP